MAQRGCKGTKVPVQWDGGPEVTRSRESRWAAADSDGVQDDGDDSYHCPAGHRSGKVIVVTDMFVQVGESLTGLVAPLRPVVAQWDRLSSTWSFRPSPDPRPHV